MQSYTKNWTAPAGLVAKIPARPNGDTSGKTSPCFEISADLQRHFSVSETLLSFQNCVEIVELGMVVWSVRKALAQPLPRPLPGTLGSTPSPIAVQIACTVARIDAPNAFYLLIELHAYLPTCEPALNLP
jgi:hypothetical protein